MPKVPLSPFLSKRRDLFRNVAKALSGRWDFASLLATDTRGMSFRASPTELIARDSDWSERGLVARLQRDGLVVEIALDEIPADAPDSVERLAELLHARAERLVSRGEGIRYPPLGAKPATLSDEAIVGIDPFKLDSKQILDKVDAQRLKAMAVDPMIVYAMASMEFVHVSKTFFSADRELSQSFILAEGYLYAMARRGEVQKTALNSCSGRKGLEVLDEMAVMGEKTAREAIELLDSGELPPGEYDVIMAPDISGLLAHEAFGHGVETDMFVKNRAKAAEYIGKYVASPIVDMYDGAAGADASGSFLFDDEGTLASSTLIIDKGILVSGISDSLSAARLNLRATGNGRRQTFSHKAYARMTNTYFGPGKDTKEAMIAAIAHGWLLEHMESGMEDPKNWGIQLVVAVGREIRDGKLTGRVVSPVVCSGYVPDVLSAIDMISETVVLEGSGACGKGHKEYVKVSAGGPYVKTRMRLG